MGEFFTNHFRNEGVESFFQGKERAIPEMSREIRHTIETELFENGNWVMFLLWNCKKSPNCFWNEWEKFVKN